MFLVPKAKVHANPKNTKDSSHSVYSLKAGHPPCALPQRAFFAVNKNFMTTPYYLHVRMLSHKVKGVRCPHWWPRRSDSARIPTSGSGEAKGIRKFPSPKHIWIPSAPDAGAQSLRFAFAPARAATPGLCCDPRAHSKALRPKAPVTLGGARTAGRSSIPSRSTPPASLTKAPCQSEARHTVAGLPIADRQQPLASAVVKKKKINTELGKERGVMHSVKMQMSPKLSSLGVPLR